MVLKLWKTGTLTIFSGISYDFSGSCVSLPFDVVSFYFDPVGLEGGLVGNDEAVFLPLGILGYLPRSPRDVLPFPIDLVEETGSILFNHWHGLQRNATLTASDKSLHSQDKYKMIQDPMRRILCVKKNFLDLPCHYN